MLLVFDLSQVVAVSSFCFMSKSMVRPRKLLATSSSAWASCPVSDAFITSMDAVYRSADSHMIRNSRATRDSVKLDER